MKDIVNAACTTVEEYGGHFVCWSGTYFDTHNFMLRLDKTFLMLVSTHKTGGGATLRRIPGITRSAPGADPKVYFTLQNTYRICSGARRGMLVTKSSQLEGDEKWRLAGLQKVLRMGRLPSQFSTKRKGDVSLMPMLSALPDFTEVSDIEECLPEFYLTCTPGNNELRVRRSGDALCFIEGFEDYDDALSPDENLVGMKTQVSRDAGAGRVAYPYQFVNGRGVVAVEVAGSFCIFGTWYRVPEIRCDLHHVEIG